MLARERVRLRGLRRGMWGLGICAALACAGPAIAQPVPLKDRALVDQRGQALQVSQMAGRPVLLHFVFTACSSTCPVQVHELATLQDSLPAEARSRLRIVSVTVDPLSDTPKQMLAFAQRMGAADRPGWFFSTGKPDQVERLIDRMQALGPAGQRRPVEDHRTSLFLFGADGNLVQRFRGTPVDRARLNDEITRLVRPSHS
jgi:protein SCO1/2